MAALASATRIRSFLAFLGRSAQRPATMYLTGGSTAVLLGWRESTIDVDIKLVPAHDELLRAVAVAKDELSINVELASPDLFIPVAPGWEERSPWVATEGRLTIRTLTSSRRRWPRSTVATSVIARTSREMLSRGLVTAGQVSAKFSDLEPELYRIPAIDPGDFRRAVDRALAELR